MAKYEKAIVSNVIEVGDTVRVNYKQSPLYGEIAKVEKILGNRSRPCYQCTIKGNIKYIARAFLEKIEEEKEEEKEGKKNDTNSNN